MHKRFFAKDNQQWLISHIPKSNQIINPKETSSGSFKNFTDKSA